MFLASPNNSEHGIRLRTSGRRSIQAVLAGLGAIATFQQTGIIIITLINNNIGIIRSINHIALRSRTLSLHVPSHEWMQISTNISFSDGRSDRCARKLSGNGHVGNYAGGPLTELGNPFGNSYCDVNKFRTEITICVSTFMASNDRRFCIFFRFGRNTPC